ncbi:MAG: pentapeptide repeat-containing protein [Ardenticatenaceae bacterium]|nr:pentapeptide repeat-containing protein [Ardenticatenaceae bacterium]
MQLMRKQSNSSDNDSTIECTGQHISAPELKQLIEKSSLNNTRNQINLNGHCLHNESLIPISDLSNMSFNNCNLRGVKFANCDLHNSSFKNADLRKADLYRANLSLANLEEANLHGANLEEANLTEARLLGAKLDYVNLINCVLYRTLIQQKNLGKRIKQELDGDYLNARIVYLRLKENFQSIGAYDSASWAYFRERVAERHSILPFRASKFYVFQLTKEATFFSWLGFYVKYTVKWLSALLLELIWGYGQKPQRVLGFCLSIIISFAFIYGALDGIEKLNGVEPTILELLVYSLATFTVSSLPDIEPVSRVSQIISSLEAILGVTSLALFTTALAQRMGGR